MKVHPLILLGSLFLLLTPSCDRLGLMKKRPSGVIAEANGQYLYMRQLNEATAVARNVEDSAHIADNFIEQWATDVLLYDVANNHDDVIEEEVERYRRELYVHSYEQQLIEEHMPKEVDDETLQQFYDTHKGQFVLSEPILKGLLLIVPVDAPRIEDLRTNVKRLGENDLESIEKYAYNYSKGYELFLDNWCTASMIMTRMPLLEPSWQNKLSQKMYYEYNDGIYIYILKSTEFYGVGQTMPVDYAREEIQKVIINERKVQFILSERHKLYENALKRGTVKK